MPSATNPPKRIAFVAGSRGGREGKRLQAVERDISRVYGLLIDPELGGCCASDSPPMAIYDSSVDFTEALLDSLENWQKDDQFIFYFTGHGEISGSGSYNMLFGDGDSDIRRRNHLPFNNVKEYLSNHEVYRAIFILDTCFSGKGIKSKSILAHTLPDGMAFIASSQADQWSFELEDESQSLFTHLFCEGIESGLGDIKTADGNISDADIVIYINKALESQEYRKYTQRAIRADKDTTSFIWVSKNRSGSLQPADPNDGLSYEEKLKTTNSNEHPSHGVRLHDYDWELIEEYRSSRFPNVSKKSQQEKLLRDLGLYSTILEGVPRKPTVLCFASRPEKFISCAISTLIIGDPDDSSFHRKDITGPLSQQIEMLSSRLLNELNVIHTVEENGDVKKRPEIDSQTIRELISNAITHRDYNQSGQVTVILKKNVLEIKSPGSFPENISWQSQISSKTSISKPVNPEITRQLTALPGFEGLGRGFSAFKRYINENGPNSITYEELDGPTTLIRIRRKPVETRGDRVVSPSVGGDIAIGDAVVGHKIIYNLPHPRPDFVSNLPSFNHNFIGQQAYLQHIAANFATISTLTTQSLPLVVTQAISGMGGVGKTQIALAYAHMHRDQYDIIWMLPADNTTVLDASLRELGEVMELNIADKDVRTARQMVLNALSNGEKQVFLIYDNADEITPHDLIAYLPSGCHLLISSRRDASQWRGIAQTVTLKTFTEADAMVFWERRLDGGEVGILPKARLLEREALAEALGWLPLAMEQAAALMLTRKMSAAVYLDIFQRDYDEIKARENIPDRYHATVATTWGMNFEQVKRTEGAAELLNLCSFFAPTDIPLQLMQDNVDLLPDELAAVMADETWGIGDALEALQSYSLLTVTNDGDTVAVHRLVQLVARERMGTAQAADWASVAVNLLASVYNFDKYDMRTWVVCGQLMPHVTMAVTLAADLDVDSTQTAYLNHKGSLYLQTYGDYQGAMLFVQRALDINQNIMGSEHPDTAENLNNMAYLLQTMGNYEGALPFYQQSLAIRKKALGDDHPDTASSLNNMGYLLQAMGDLQGARPFYEQALAIRQKALGDDHPDTAQSLNNMGYLLQAMGDYEDARPFYERALAIREKQLGLDHPDVATSYNNLAVLAYDEGDMQEAARLMRRALAIREKALGNTHPDTQDSRRSLATVEAAA